MVEFQVWLWLKLWNEIFKPALYILVPVYLIGGSLALFNLLFGID